MGKSIGLLLAVAAIWVTVELYAQGPDQAFGGRFARWIGSGDAEHPHGSTAQRAGAAVGRARAEENARREKLLPE